MKKLFSVLKNIFKNKKIVISIISTLSLVGVYTLYDYSFNKPTVINSFIAAKIYSAPANENFSDDVFYQCVVDAYNEKHNTQLAYTINLSTSQLDSIERVTCSIGSLNYITGVELLTNLKELSFYDGSHITDIDVSKNLKLEKLHLEVDYYYGRFDSNQAIDDLNLTNNTSLKTLEIIGFPHIEDLDLSKNLNLSKLQINYNYRMTNLNLTNNTKLIELNLDNLSIGSIDLSQNVLLESLTLDNSDDSIDGKIKTLNLANNKNMKNIVIKNLLMDSINLSSDLLETLTINGTNINAIDLNYVPNIKNLNLSNNQFSNFEIKGLESLEDLNISNNQLTTIKVENLLSLKNLLINNNMLTSIQIVNSNAIENINVSNNLLNELTLSNILNLTTLNLSNNKDLKKVNLSNVENIPNFVVENNNNNFELNLSNSETIENLNLSYLTKLNCLKISDFTKLNNIEINNTDLKSIVTTNTPLIANVNLANNKLSSFNLSSYEKITKLILSNNELESLDLSTATRLTELYANNNLLNNVLLGNSKYIKIIDLSHNKISNIDLKSFSYNYLEEIKLSNNLIQTLDVSELNNVVVLDVANNQLSSIGLNNCTSLEKITLYNNNFSESSIIDFTTNKSIKYIYFTPDGDLEDFYNDNNANNLSIKEFFTNMNFKGEIVFGNVSHYNKLYIKNVLYFDNVYYGSKTNYCIGNNKIYTDIHFDPSASNSVSLNFEIPDSCMNMTGDYVIDFRTRNLTLKETLMNVDTNNTYSRNYGNISYTEDIVHEAFNLKLSSDSYVVNDNNEYFIDIFDDSINNDILKKLSLNYGELEIEGKKLHVKYDGDIIQTFEIKTTASPINITNSTLSNSINDEAKWFKGYDGSYSFELTSIDSTIDLNSLNIDIVNNEGKFNINKELVDNKLVVTISNTSAGFESGTYTINISNSSEQLLSTTFTITEPVKVTSITAEDFTIERNTDASNINYTISPSEAIDNRVEIEIIEQSEEGVIEITSDNKIKGLKDGTAKIIIKALDGSNVQSEEINISVIEKGIDISYLEENNPIYEKVGGKYNFRITLNHLNLNEVDVDLTDGENSLYNKKVTINDKGYADVELDIPSTINNGSYLLRVSSSDNEYVAEDTLTILKYVNVKDISLNKENITLLIGNEESLIATLTAEDGYDKVYNDKITWNSSNEEIATVDENGKVIAVARSLEPVTITATADGGKTATCVVTVIDPKILNINKIIHSSYDDILFKEYGGEINVTLETQDISDEELVGQYYYKVNDGIEEEIRDLETINKIHLSTITNENENIKRLKFTISPELEVGSYKVDLYYSNTNIVNFTFDVLEPVKVHEIQANDIVLPFDELYHDIAYSLLAETENQNVTDNRVSFEVGDSSVIDLSGNKIKGLKTGTTTITIKSLDGSEKTKTINVTVVEKTISLTDQNITPNVVYSNNLTQSLYDIDGGTIKMKLDLLNINELTPLNYVLVKKDDNAQNNIITKISVNKTNELGNKYLTLNISANSLEPGEYEFKAIGENTIESNTINFTINEYISVENVDIKYNNQSIKSLNLIVGRENLEVNGIINETATNKQVEWILNNDNCSISDDNSHGIFLNAEKVGQCQITFKSKEKHNSEVNLEKTLIINVIDGNSIVNDSLHQSKISNNLVDVKYGGIITNAIQFNNLKEDSNLLVEVYDGSKLLGMDYVEKDIMLLNNMLGTISLNIIPDVFNKPNEYTPSKELTVKYTYTLNDIDNTELTKEYKVNLSEYNPITKINLSKTDIKLDINESVNISSLISFEPNKATNKEYYVVIDNNNIVKFENNYIKSINEGNAKVTIISEENENVKATINVTVEKNDYLEFSSKVKIHNESGSKYLKGFNASNTYKELMSNIDTNMNVILKESNGTKVTSNSSILKTGMKLSIGDNTYDVVIKGDMSGDGKISITDLSQMRYHLAQTKGKIKSGAYKQAGDMNDSNTVTITDLSQMRKKLAGGN